MMKKLPEPTVLRSATELRQEGELPLSPFAYSRGYTPRDVSIYVRKSNRNSTSLLNTAGIISFDDTKNRILDDLELHLSVTLGRHLALTGFQACDLLNAKHRVEIGYKRVFDCLDLLTGLGKVRQTFLEEANGKKIKVYRLSEEGAADLRSKGYSLEKVGYSLRLEVPELLRILSVNQMLSRYGITDDLKLAEAIYSPGTTEFSIRPQATLQLEKTYLIESVRSSADWEVKLAAKLKRYEHVFSKGRYLNVRLYDPTLMLIGESVDHCRSIMDIAKDMTIATVYSSDDLLYATPSAAFYSLPKRITLRSALREFFQVR